MGHLISETTRFHCPDELSMDGMECERQQIQTFLCKMHCQEDMAIHLELLKSSEKFEKSFFTPKVIETSFRLHDSIASIVSWDKYRLAYFVSK